MKRLSADPAVFRGQSLWDKAFTRFKRNRLAMAGLLFLAVLALVCVAAPWIAPYSFAAQNLALGAAAPNTAHWFGTDLLGRDLFTRVIFGGRISLLVGLCATAVALFIGVLWGSVAALGNRLVDAVMMRIVDILYAFPFTMFVIILMVFFGRSMILLFAAIGAVEWLTMARIVRGQIKSLRQREFVEAAQALGVSSCGILFRHLLPNILGPVIVYTTLMIPGVMLLEAFLSFLGLGVQPPQCSWGILIRDGAECMEQCPWMLVFPGLFLSATLFALNFVGDGLRDALDPAQGEKR